ncbi:hypothetical protein ACFQHW_08295 [Lapidilactobacillus achengensis]|uniref:Uncharacterized protein n=1 Tax=Lapidilactobacillus achengensis TaxID=2486000 RepID=A0ABW1UPH5_9LACO|nr:hypothetical protein [Lapidilactobacillus achengensis]
MDPTNFCRRKRAGSITLLTLTILTFDLLLIGLFQSYYSQRVTHYQNQNFYYQQQNQQLRRQLK